MATADFTSPCTARTERASPRYIAPASPMKIDAGWKLKGKNPKTAPARAVPGATAIALLDMARTMAAEVIPTILAASPSRPSDQFIRFSKETIHKIVRAKDHADEDDLAREGSDERDADA